MRSAPAPGLAKRLGRLGLGLAALAGPAAAQDEVPFVTTPDRVTLAMLELAGVGPADYVIDLGSGDGRIVIRAAQKYGVRAIGIEMDRLLLDKAHKDAKAAGVSHLVQFRAEDAMKTDLTKATVVTLYLLSSSNMRLRPLLTAQLRPLPA